MTRIIFMAVAVLTVLALPAEAADIMAGTLKISAPWARATPKGTPVGGGYLTVTNMGDEPDRLVGGSTAISKSVEVHEMKMDNGIMKMRMLANGLEINPGQTLTLQPGGYHLMFIGLTQPLKKGEHIKVTLQFAKAGNVDVEFTVEGIGAMRSGGATPRMKMH